MKGEMLRLLSDGGKKFLRALIIGYSSSAEPESDGTALSDSNEDDQSGIEPFRCTSLHMVTTYEVRLLRSHSQ